LLLLPPNSAALKWLPTGFFALLQKAVDSMCVGSSKNWLKNIETDTMKEGLNIGLEIGINFTSRPCQICADTIVLHSIYQENRLHWEEKYYYYYSTKKISRSHAKKVSLTRNL
jgi:hypothetical protein